MYVIIGRHFVPLEGKFLLIALIIVRIPLNVIVRQMPLNNGVSIVFATSGNNIVQVFESLTRSF